MMLRSVGIVAITCSVMQTGCRCDQDQGAAAGQASASASAAEVRATVPTLGSAAAAGEKGERLLLPRPELSKEPPPEQPPPGAQPLALGAFYRQLARGKERTLSADERVYAELKAWDETGKVLTDTTTRPEPLMFAQRTLPEPLRVRLAEQPIGSAFQLWLPAAATQGWKLPEWPSQGTVRVELHVIGAVTVQSTVRTVGGGTERAAKFKPPASTGPPANAKQGPNGLRYLWLESGPEGSQPEGTSRVTLRLTGYSVEGVVVSEIVRDQRTEMDLAKAPKAIAHVLGKMVRGDSVRAWLEPALAKEVFPQTKSAVVVDVTLLEIE
ncbi:MAG TPA: hypothetical protein VFU02_17130 [Polyangiaceae bacterium]|nr:hypothetical protein [Polyangiaceae bacterium]